jgi:hypothetical protein
LSVLDGGLEQFPDDALMHFDRAVVLQELERYGAADGHGNVARLTGDSRRQARAAAAALRASRAYRMPCSVVSLKRAP